MILFPRRFFARTDQFITYLYIPTPVVKTKGITANLKSSDSFSFKFLRCLYSEHQPTSKS